LSVYKLADLQKDVILAGVCRREKHGRNETLIKSGSGKEVDPWYSVEGTGITVVTGQAS